MFLFLLIDFNEEAIFTRTAKGNFKLSHEGFQYTRHTTNKKDLTYWECVRKRRYNCRGRAQTRLIDGIEMAKFYGTHNHHLDDSEN